MRNETFQETMRFVISKLTLMNYDSWYFTTGYIKVVCADLWINVPLNMAKPIARMLSDCGIMFKDIHLATTPTKFQIDAYWRIHFGELKKRLMLWTVTDDLYENN